MNNVRKGRPYGAAFFRYKLGYDAIIIAHIGRYMHLYLCGVAIRLRQKIMTNPDNEAANAMTEAQETQPLDDALNFEQALKQLEDIVRKLERGDAPLDSSIDLYVKGEKLRALCQKRLDAAEAKIEKIRMNVDGQASGSEAFDKS